MVQEVVHAVDPETAVEDVRPMDELIDDSLWRERLMRLVGIGLLAGRLPRPLWFP